MRAGRTERAPRQAEPRLASPALNAAGCLWAAKRPCCRVSRAVAVVQLPPYGESKATAFPSAFLGSALRGRCDRTKIPQLLLLSVLTSGYGGARLCRPRSRGPSVRCPARFPPTRRRAPRVALCPSGSLQSPPGSEHFLPGQNGGGAAFHLRPPRQSFPTAIREGGSEAALSRSRFPRCGFSVGGIWEY